MTSFFFLLFFSIFFLFSAFTIASSPPSYPYGLSYRIDCGSLSMSIDSFNTTWLSDRFFTGGAISPVSDPLRFRQTHEKTLRYFPLSSSENNCYIIPNLPPGRYFIRTFTIYNNYDGESHSPSFDVSVEGTVVFSWRSPWPDDLAQTGAYSDLFAFVTDSNADVCFHSIADDAPVIGSLMLVRVDPTSYDAVSTDQNYILVNYGRFSCGSDAFGPGFTNDTDLFGRSWQNDDDFRSTDAESPVRSVITINSISNVDQAPNYFPAKLYQSAAVVEGEGVMAYELPVDAELDYLLWLHFAEIDLSVTEAGQRVFDVVINGENVTRIDIYEEVGSFAAYSSSYRVKNLKSTVLTVELQSVAGAALICGLENYALVPARLE